MANGNYRTQDRIVEELSILRELLGQKGAMLYFRTASQEDFANEHLSFGKSEQAYSFSGSPSDPIYADLRADGSHLLFWVQRTAGKHNLVGVVTSDPRVVMRTGNLLHWQKSPDHLQALSAVGIK